VSARRILASLLLAAGLLAPACATRQPPPAPPQPPPTLPTPTPPAPLSTPRPPAPVSVPRPPSPIPPPPPTSGAIDCPVKREWTGKLLPDRPEFRAELRECASKDPLELPRQQVALWQPGLPAIAWGLENRDDAGDRFLIDKVEPTDLDGDGAQELLILMHREGTGGYLDWCLLAKKGAGLGCWDAPDVEAPAKKLLRPDEDFGFHGWQLSAQPHTLLLTRGIYRKGVDPNCCPSRGSVVVRIVPREGRLVASSVSRSAAKSGGR
jgi:hypothetical protein